MTFLFIVILFIWLLILHNKVSTLEGKIFQRGLQFKTESKLALHDDTLTTFSDKQSPAPVPPPAPAHSTVLTKSVSEINFDRDILGGGWLYKIGVVALIFGVGFFLKFAIDSGWIGVWLRIIIGLIIGGLLIFLGDIWRQKYQNYAYAITGGGLAILYFTIYAAYDFYSLIPQFLAVLLMTLITGAAVYLSVRYKSMTVGVMATFGGFASPLLLLVTQSQQIELFAYLLLLNLGILIALYRIFSFELLYISLVGTYFNYLVWAGRFSDFDNTFTSVLFLTVMYMIFVIAPTYFSLNFKIQEDRQSVRDKYIALFTAVAVVLQVIVSVLLISGHYQQYLSLNYLMLGLIAVTGYLLVQNLASSKITSYILAAAGISLLFAAILEKFEGVTQDLLVLFFAVFLMIVGVFYRKIELRVSGFGLIVFDTLTVLVSSYAAGAKFLLNEKFFTTVMVILGMWIMSAIYDLAEVGKDEKKLSRFLRVIAFLLLWFNFSHEIVQYYHNSVSSNARNLFLSLWWMCYAVAILGYGAYVRDAVFRKLAVFFFALTIAKVFLYDVQALDTGYRIASFIILGIILLSVSYVYQHNKDRINTFLEGEQAINLGNLPK